MSDFRAPLRDIRFTLDHLAGLEHLLSLEAFQSTEPDVVDSLLQECARFVQDLVAPLNRVGDIEGSSIKDGKVVTPSGYRETYRSYVEAGWGTIGAPAKWGGAAMPRILGVAVEEIFTSGCLSFSTGPLLTAGAISAIERHGTEQQKDQFLPKLITGEWAATMNLTEPHAGSDVGALHTKALPSEDGTYRVTGTKIFITYGEHDLSDNIIHLVLARVPGSPPGTKGISMFLVPKFLPDAHGEPAERNDLKAISLEHKLGIKATPTCVMSYGEDRGGAVGYLLGKVNQGMANMFTMMNTARVSVAIQGMAVAERAYQQAAAYARERRQGRAVGATEQMSPIVEHPDVRRMLMTMRSLTEAMRALIYRTAMHQDMSVADPDPDQRRWHSDCLALLTPVIKSWCTEIGVEVASIGIQVHGGVGYIEETGATQHWRDARITPIYEGTNGIQAIDLVGRKLPMEGGHFVKEYIRSMTKTVEWLREQAWFGPADNLEKALSGLEKATDWLLAEQARPNQVLAGASPYCLMFGGIAAGALMAEAALSAISSGDGDKQATCRFFLNQLLPPYTALQSAVTAGEDDLFAIEAASL
ncbi:MAG: acyl-CoA dehydrogenase [bacterium]|nr:acyl-CoA dehydrogenase [bacterium]